jgi:hypothetical protein
MKNARYRDRGNSGGEVVVYAGMKVIFTVDMRVMEPIGISGKGRSLVPLLGLGEVVEARSSQSSA